MFARMQRFSMFFLGLLFFTLPMICLAQEVLPEVPTQDFIGFLLQSLGGLKGMSTLAVVGVVVQLLIQFLKTPLCAQVFKAVSGPTKLLIVTGLTLVAGVVSLMSVEGLSLGAAIVHSTTLSAFMVFGNQIYKQFIEKKA